MKPIIFTIVFLLSIFSFSQNFQGKAYYKTMREFKIKIDSTGKIPSAEQIVIKEMIQKQMQKTYILTFNKTQSLYKEEVQLDEPMVAKNGITIKIGNSNDVLYKNTKNKTYTDSREVFGKRFLIKDTIKSISWKIEKETKKIGKYTCIKATATKLIDDYEGFKKKEKQKEITITAWFTPEIPVSNGPELYYGLPGLIMELHEDKMHYVCNKLILNSKKPIEIKVPSKGKIVSKKQYESIMEKKQKEMMEQFKNSRKKGKRNSFTQVIQVN